MLDIDNVHPLRNSPVDSSIDILNDVAVVFRDVILDVDNDKCFCLHILFVIKLQSYVDKNRYRSGHR